MRLIFLILIFSVSVINAQENVTCNGQDFDPAEVVEAQVGNSGETFSFTYLK